MAFIFPVVKEGDVSVYACKQIDGFTRLVFETFSLRRYAGSAQLTTQLRKCADWTLSKNVFTVARMAISGNKAVTVVTKWQ